MVDIAGHRAVVDHALAALGLGRSAWPDVVVDDRLPPTARMSAVLVLLADDLGDEWDFGDGGRLIDPRDDTLDWAGRSRSPWQQLARTRLAWDAQTAATALRIVATRRLYDERRLGIALRGARAVAEAGRATVELVDGLQACVTRLTWEEWQGFRPGLKELQLLARRVLISVSPPDLLDLSLLVAGDAWAGPARTAAASLPPDDIAGLVRLLGDLGPRKPSKAWLAAVAAALEPAPARQLLREWLELAAHTDVVPESPRSRVGDCRGTLFVGTNTDIVRAAVWATSRVLEEDWPVDLLATLARRGETHNGAPGFPEALSLKVATAAVDALVVRGGEADRLAIRGLAGQLQRRDLLRKVNGALTDPDQGAASSARRVPAGAVAELLRLKSDHAVSLRATQLVSGGRDGEAVVVAALGRGRGVNPYVLVEALGSASPGGEAEQFLLTQVQTGAPMMRAASLLALVEVQKEGATTLLAQIVATQPGTHLRVLAVHLLATAGDRRGRQTVLEYLTRVLSRKGRQDMVPPLLSLAGTYLLSTAEGREEVEQVAQLLSKRRANLTALDLRWIGEHWPGEWLTQGGARPPLPDVDRMRRFIADPALQRVYFDLYSGLP